MRFLVTAGPTCEDLDEARFLSNRSSGKMGYAIAAAAAAAGHETVLVSGPVALDPPRGIVTLVPVRSAAEMLRALEEQLEAADALLMAAAVADFRPAEFFPGKLPKGERTLRLLSTPDILRALRERKGRRLFLGFALEAAGLSREGRARAKRKLAEKGLDLIVLNGPTSFGSSRIAAELLGADGSVEALGELEKEEAARRIVARVEELARTRR